MKRIAILGAADLGQLMAHYLVADGGCAIAGFFDDRIPRDTVRGSAVVLGTAGDIVGLYRNGVFDELLIGIGYKHFGYRWKCFCELRELVPLNTFAHSTCYVDRAASVGEGTFLMPRCIVDAHAKIGRNVFLQLGCVISHHTEVGDNCFLAPGVILSGCVKVESGCFLGAGTVCIDNINLGPGVFTGAGTVVTESLLEPGVYVGVPARRIK